MSNTSLPNPFCLLIQDIKKYLNEIDIENTDIDYLKSLMSKYISNPSDWQKYAYADQSKHYTRNLVESIDGKATILVLVWNPHMGSPVHDHATAHCVVKVLQGNLREERFAMPVASSQAGPPLQLIKDTVSNQDEVTYICDDIGLHRVSNACEDNELAVSLHVYTPPRAAEYGFHIYDEESGRRLFVGPAKAVKQ